MLHKMYLVPVEEYHPTPPAKKVRPPHRSTKQQPHTEWIKLRSKHREAELQRNARTNEIAYYMKQIMPAATISQHPTAGTELHKLKAKSRQNAVTDTHIRPSKGIIYETPEANLSKRMMMSMSFSRRTQRGLVEKM